MKFLEVLKSVHTRLIRKRLMEIAVVLCALFSNMALLAYLLGFLGWMFSVSVLAVCAMLALFFSWRRRFFRLPRRIEAAQVLDQHFSSKDRSLALLEFYKSEEAGIVKDPRAELIEEQLKKKLAGFSLGLIVPFTLSTRLKGFVASVPLSLGILLLLLYLSAPELSPEVQRDVDKLEKVIAEEKLPEDLKEKMEDLVNSLKDQAASTEEISKALQAAKDELAKSKEELAQEHEKQQKMPDLAASPEPQAQPSPTVEPSPTVQEKEQQEKEKQSQETKPQDQQKKEQQETEQEKKEEQKKEQQDSKEKQEQQKDQKQDKQEQQEQASDQSQSQSASEKQKQEEESEDKPGEQGQQGEGQAKGQGSQGKAGESGQEQGQEKGAAQGQQSEGKSAGQSALDKAEQALGEVEKNQENKSSAKSGQKQDQQQGQQQDKQQQGKDQEGKGQQGKEQQGKEQQGKEQQGEKQQGQKQQGKEPGDSKSQGESAKPEGKGSNQQGSKPDQQDKQGEKSDSNSDDQSSSSSKSSLPKDNQAAARPLMGEEGPPGLGENKAFKEQSISSAEEKFDTRFTSKQGELAENKQEARPKTNLGDIKLAKPEIDQAENAQRIPLEYEDLM